MYASNKNGVPDLYRIAVSGVAGDDSLYQSNHDKRPADWSTDGRLLAFVENDPQTRTDVWVLDLNSGRKPMPVVNTPAVEDQPRFSPDGKWIAYCSNRTGRREIYVQPLPSGEPVMVSVNGGSEPFWRPNGQELFFVSPENWVMAVGVKAGGKFDAGLPTRLFELPRSNCTVGDCRAVDVTRDGRFLVSTADYAPAAPMRVITNWRSILNK